MALAGKRPACDVTLADCANPGLAVATQLSVKGVCSVDAGISAEQLESAKGDLGAARFGDVHPIIAESLLGVEGSSKILHVGEDEEGLISLEKTIFDMSRDLGGYCEGYLNFDPAGRTSTIAHLQGDVSDDALLTDDDVDFWLPQFARHKVMIMILFDKGVVEIAPYTEVEEATNFEVEVFPGMMLLVRPDLMSHTYVAGSKALALSSFLVMRKTGSMEGETMAPVARHLDQWVVNRLDQLRDTQSLNAVWDPSIPKDWQRMMNRLAHKGQKVAVRGIGNLSTVSWEKEVWANSMTSGIDTCVYVPLKRWDHSRFHGPEPDSWKQFKTSAKHGGFMEGVELFDAKFFSISIAEAKGMDPCQRLILETGAIAYFEAGYDKKKLMNSICGVFVGFGNAQWSFVEDKEIGAACMGCSVAGSIHSNRFSFCLGMKGPSMTIDASTASSLVALHSAAEGVQQKGSGMIPPASLAVGAHAMLTAVLWTFNSAAGFLSTEGRCMAFDESADGFVHADNFCGAVVSPLAELVDNDINILYEDSSFGSIAASCIGHCGKVASITAPSSVAIQDIVAETLRNGHLNGIDIDFVEATSTAHIIDDTIEFSALHRSHRSMQDEAPFVVTSGKTLQGNHQEATALNSFLRALLWSRRNTIPQQIHLRKVNPYMDLNVTTGNLINELCQMKLRSTFAGTFSQGYGGTTANCINFAVASNIVVKDPLPLDRQIHYWAGGGGTLDEELVPSKGYHIYGSFNGYMGAETMKPEGEGKYTYTITLGENSFESFEIRLDGKMDKVLHPGYPKAGQDAKVCGPSQDNEGCAWLIDGRDMVCSVRKTGEEGSMELAEMEQVAKPHPDSGKPGDQYKVILSVNGKWQNVSWAKLSTTVPLESLAAGSYYIVGSWSNWDFEEMTHEEDGSWTFEVDLSAAKAADVHRPAGGFQIVRDKDWSQTFLPVQSDFVEESTDIIGPCDADLPVQWLLIYKGRYKVTFKRTVDESGVDEKSIKTEKIDALGN